MGKGGGQAATQTQVQDVPDWAKPSYQKLLSATEGQIFDITKGPDGQEQISIKPYQAYEGQRLANLSGDIATSQQTIRNLAGQPIAGFAEAASAFGDLGARAQQLGQQRSADFSEAQFTPFTGFSAGVAQAAQYDPARQFTGEEVSRYMSPYMQAVVDRERESAIRESERQRGSRAARAVQASAFGGSRQAVQEAMAEEALARQLGDIQATGSQRAFEQAAALFQSDRAAQMETQARQIAELARAEGITIAEAARVQQASAADLARIEAGRAAEMARVQQARADEAMRQRQFELQAMGFSADMAAQLASLGERARAGDIQAAQLLEAQGLGEMAREQAGLDIAYQDYLRQQQYPMEQLGQYSAILRGLPMGAAGTTTTYQATPSAAQQALGTGISAYGLYRGLQ